MVIKTIRSSCIMNSHFSLVLVTHRSSENSSPVSGLLPVFRLPENTSVWAGYRSVRRSRHPSVNPLTALWCFPHATTAALLSSMWWASCQGTGSGEPTSHPITDHTRNRQSCNSCTLDWKSTCHIMGVTFWSCEWYFMFMEKHGVIMCFKCLPNKSCPESPKTWTFYAL